MLLTLFALSCGQLAQADSLTVAGPTQLISKSDGAWKSHIGLALPLVEWMEPWVHQFRALSQHIARSVGNFS